MAEHEPMTDEEARAWARERVEEGLRRGVRVIALCKGRSTFSLKAPVEPVEVVTCCEEWWRG